MAHFIGNVRGQRGAASRIGSKAKGLIVNCNGWEAGIRIEANHNPQTGRDIFTIFATTGSGYGSEFEIGKVTTDGSGKVRFEK